MNTADKATRNAAQHPARCAVMMSAARLSVQPIDSQRPDQPPPLPFPGHFKDLICLDSRHAASDTRERQQMPPFHFQRINLSSTLFFLVILSKFSWSRLHIYVLDHEQHWLDWRGLDSYLWSCSRCYLGLFGPLPSSNYPMHQTRRAAHQHQLSAHGKYGAPIDQIFILASVHRFPRPFSWVLCGQAAMIGTRC